MAKNTLKDLFIKELVEMQSSESQIVRALPKFIKLASSTNLKNALSNHLTETKRQVTRLNSIFNALGVRAPRKESSAMRGLIQEANNITRNKAKSPTLDAGIIAAFQKIEHYEIATYGTLRSFANHLNFNSRVSNLIQDSLNEEGAADKKLTKIAEGGFFTSGINENAVRVRVTSRKTTRAKSRSKSTRRTSTAARRRPSSAKRRSATARRRTSATVSRARGRTLTRSKRRTVSTSRARSTATRRTTLSSNRTRPTSVTNRSPFSTNRSFYYPTSTSTNRSLYSTSSRSPASRRSLALARR